MSLANLGVRSLYNMYFFRALQMIILSEIVARANYSIFFLLNEDLSAKMAKAILLTKYKGQNLAVFSVISLYYVISFQAV
jgi:hypothetical protein